MSYLFSNDAAVGASGAIFGLVSWFNFLLRGHTFSLDFIGHNIKTAKGTSNGLEC